MRSRLRASDFSHSRSFSAPTVPSLRLTPPTPHGSFHERDYDSDDSIPSSAAAMPRPNRYRRSATRTTSHPYASSSQSSSSSSTVLSEQDQQINPGFFSGTCNGRKIAAFNITMSPDGIVTIQGQLLPSQFPSQTVQERRSLSQPSSPLFFQAPIDPSIAALGLQNPPATTVGDAVEPLPMKTTMAPQERVLPLMSHPVGKMENMFVNPYLDFQQGFPMWPVEQINVHSGTSSVDKR